MGIFDFVKDAGKKVAKYADLISEVHALGIEIAQPEVHFHEGTASISGQVKSQEDREKIILALGNVDGVERVQDELEVLESQEESIFHTVKAGDSLSKIAKQHYGDPMKYTDIFEANKPMLSDPNKIFPGQVLRIPKL